MLILCVSLTNVVAAQKKIVLEGVVLDFESKRELVYANLYCKNISVGTFTNSEGKFVLVVPETAKNETLKVSCIGYYESEIIVSQFIEDTIYLLPKINMLEEVEIISEYNPEEILKKVYKKRKTNYPFEEQYCCKAYYREYFKRNDTTVQILELVGAIKEKGIKYNSLEHTQMAIDSIYNFYRRDDVHIFSSLSFFEVFLRDGFKNQFNGTLQVDSVFFLNNEKQISITYIPKKSDTITYEAYEYSAWSNTEQISENETLEKRCIKVVSTSQYSSISRFIVNLKDYALVEYFSSYNLLGEPEKFDLKVNNLYMNESNFFLKYEKKNGIYFPTQIKLQREYVFVKEKNSDEVDYKLNILMEYILEELENDCTNTAFTNEYLFYEDFRKKHQNKTYEDKVIPFFEDEIKYNFLNDIK